MEVGRVSVARCVTRAGRKRESVVDGVQPRGHAGRAYVSHTLLSIQGHGAQDLGRGHHGVAYIPCRHGQRQGGAGVGWGLVRQSLYTYLHTHLQP